MFSNTQDRLTSKRKFMLWSNSEHSSGHLYRRKNSSRLVYGEGKKKGKIAKYCIIRQQVEYFIVR